jgi:hypothetical protein
MCAMCVCLCNANGVVGDGDGEWLARDGDRTTRPGGWTLQRTQSAYGAKVLTMSIGVMCSCRLWFSSTIDSNQHWHVLMSKRYVSYVVSDRASGPGPERLTVR